jgi:Leucine-rich repeat (LRR) protein
MISILWILFFYFFIFFSPSYSIPLEKKAYHFASCQNVSCAKTILKKVKHLGIHKSRVYKRGNFWSIIALKSDIKIPYGFNSITYEALLRKKIDKNVYEINFHLECPEPIEKKDYSICPVENKYFTNLNTALLEKEFVHRIYLIKTNDIDIRKLFEFPNLDILEIENGENLKFTNFDWTKLNKLNLLSIKKLSHFPVEIVNLKNLKNLELIGNNFNIPSKKMSTIKKIPENIGNLMALESLSLEGNEITLLPQDITKLKKLKTLHLSYNRLQAQALDIIGELSSLEVLNLSGTDINSIPVSFSKLQKLREFVGESKYSEGFPVGTIFKEFPKNLLLLSNLEILWLNGSSFKSIPSEIGKLPRLKKMYLNDVQLINLPEEIGDLGNLEELHLSMHPNKILDHRLTLPIGICRLRKLQNLHIVGRQIDMPNLLKIVTCLPELNIIE